MKKILILLVLFTATSVYAQDMIVKKDGTAIKSKILEVGTSEIRYKKYSNQDGPLYSIDVSDVLGIYYENGDKESFENVNEVKRNMVSNDETITTKEKEYKLKAGTLIPIQNANYTKAAQLSVGQNVLFRVARDVDCSPSTINLVMDNDKSSQSLFEEFSDLISGKPVNVTLRNRKLYRDERWNTLCLPFDASLTGDLANTTVKTLVSSAFDSATGILTLIFTENSLTSIEAGKPYIVKWNTPQATNITNPEFHGVTISNSLHPVATTTTGTAPEGTVVTFDGTFSPLFIEQEDKSLLYMGAANKLYYPSGKMTIGSCRAHFRLQGIEAGDLTGNAIVLNFDGENTTGIVEMSDGRRKMEDVWFTLDGRKLNGKPTAKGVYIYKGNKRVIK